MNGKNDRKSRLQESTLRIIGGDMRGRKFIYTGEPGTRPMKDRVREAVFNLVGTSIRGATAVDLFAGTGALALEALSRGAARAVAIEKHFPMANSLRKNVAALGVENRLSLHAGDAFIWGQQQPDLGAEPWAVFCSPPYILYQRRLESLLELLGSLIDRAPTNSSFIVEADREFDFDCLPHFDQWDVRSYPPAEVGIYRKV